MYILSLSFLEMSINLKQHYDGLLSRRIQLSHSQYTVSSSFMVGFISRSHPQGAPGIPRISVAAFQAYHRDRTAMLPRAANVFVFLIHLLQLLGNHALVAGSESTPCTPGGF